MCIVGAPKLIRTLIFILCSLLLFVKMQSSILLLILLPFFFLFVRSMDKRDAVLGKLRLIDEHDYTRTVFTCIIVSSIQTNEKKKEKRPNAE